MSTSVTPKKSKQASELPSAIPLDEAKWLAWKRKGRDQEQRDLAARMKAVKWISLAGLIVAAGTGVWSELVSYEAVVRFLVAASALMVMSQAFRKRQYIFAIVFGAIALLYNPVVPVFSFSGEWQCALVVASAVPFVALLSGHNAKLVPSE